MFILLTRDQTAEQSPNGNYAGCFSNKLSKLSSSLYERCFITKTSEVHLVCVSLCYFGNQVVNYLKMKLYIHLSSYQNRQKHPKLPLNKYYRFFLL